MDKENIAFVLAAIGLVLLVLWGFFIGCGNSEGDVGIAIIPAALVTVQDEVPAYPGDSEEGSGEGDAEGATSSEPEVDEEESDDAPASTPTESPLPKQPSGGGEASGPSPTENPSRPEPAAPPSAPAPPPKPPEEPGIGLCAPAPVMRVDGTKGRFWQAAASQVPSLLKAGYTPAIYVEGIGTTCALTDVHANPNDYVLDASVLYTDGGIACPADKAREMCGDSAIHPFYRKKSR